MNLRIKSILRFIGRWALIGQVLKVTLLVFLDIAQDCSLGQYLTSSRAKTLKKKKKIGGENDLSYSNPVERPLKLACFILMSCFSICC